MRFAVTLVCLLASVGLGAGEVSNLEPLPAFTLENWDGKTLTHATFAGKTTFVVPTFAKCVFACPMITFLLDELDKELGSPPEIQYLLVSVNPDDDTAEEILLHFDKHAIDPKVDPRWLFANGSRQAIEAFLAATGIEVQRTPVEGGVVTEHTIRLFVVGPTGRTVARFDTYFWEGKEMQDALKNATERP